MRATAQLHRLLFAALLLFAIPVVAVAAEQPPDIEHVDTVEDACSVEALECTPLAAEQPQSIEQLVQTKGACNAPASADAEPRSFTAPPAAAAVPTPTSSNCTSELAEDHFTVRSAAVSQSDERSELRATGHSAPPPFEDPTERVVDGQPGAASPHPRSHTCFRPVFNGASRDVTRAWSGRTGRSCRLRA